MRRPVSNFATHLPFLKKENVGAYNWGLVSGKTQTIYPWDSWTKPYDAEPKIWFHDIFRKDGSPFDENGDPFDTQSDSAKVKFRERATRCGILTNGGFIMKKLFLLFSVMAVLSFGCSMFGMGGSKTAAGKVTVSFTWTRIPGPGSNQVAVWIENEKGVFVKTIFVTDYTTRRQGWKVRQRSLVNWVKAADLKNKAQADIDAMAGATPKAGRMSLVWDLTDAAGKPVPTGTYLYRTEGCLHDENNVLWTGRIRVGGGRKESLATCTYYPEGADKLGRTLISDVSAVYEPLK